MNFELAAEQEAQLSLNISQQIERVLAKQN